MTRSIHRLVGRPLSDEEVEAVTGATQHWTNPTQYTTDYNSPDGQDPDGGMDWDP